MFDKDEIMHIFSDADAIDFDFSRWDKQLDLYLFADHTPREGERKGFYRVSFKRVRDLAIDFGHQDMGMDLGEDDCVGWMIDDYRLERARDRWSFEFWGSPASPRVKLICETIEIERLSSQVLDELFPGWEKRFGFFARPGIVEMAMGGPRRR